MSSLIHGFFWSFTERFGVQSVSFIVSIILARLLTPDEFGLVALVMIFLNVANVFVVSGFGAALIQKKNADEIDFSTTFFFNVFFSLLIYVSLFFASPYVGVFFNQPQLPLIMKVLGLNLIFTGVNSIQRSYASRYLEFKKIFIASLWGTIGSAVVGIILAYKGFGVWALVVQSLVSSSFNAIVLRFCISWKLKFCFSFYRLRGVFSYGWKLMASSLLSSLYLELNELIIGKLYSPSNLAFYNRGKRFPALFVTNINSAVETVLFPSMAKIQDSPLLLKGQMKKSIQMCSFIIFPFVFSLAAISDNLIVVLLTEKWLDCSKFLMIACISYAFVPIGMANLQAIKAIGRSDVYLKLDVVKKTIGVVLLLLFIRYGILAIALAETISNAFGFLLNMKPNKSLMGYSPLEQVKDVLPSFLLSFFTFVCVYLEKDFFDLAIWGLCAQIFSAIAVYLILSYFFNKVLFLQFWGVIRKMRK